MWPLVVIVLDPVGDLVVCFIERHEIMLPHALFFEASEKSLDHAVLFRRVRCHVPLLQSILRHRRMKAFRTEHKTMDIRNDLFSHQRILEGSRRDPCLPRLQELPTDQIVVGTVNHHRQATPAVHFREKMSHIDRPAAVCLRSDASLALHRWERLL